MAGHLIETPFRGTLGEALPPRAGAGLTLWWLGQAGFVIDLAGVRLVIDPYLSDSLAHKYAGTALPHRRMVAPPIAPGDIRGVDIVLITHAHTDHADPGTLPDLLAANPDARIVAPAAMAELVAGRAGIEVDRLIGAQAGLVLDLNGAEIVPTRAAHEQLATDAAGRHHFLGYVIRREEFKLWHSGDCVPFDGLIQEVSKLRPALTLLPVNGRNPNLQKQGVPGNFTLAEAAELTVSVGASSMIAHHYGMFEFNTIDPNEIDHAAHLEKRFQLLRAKLCTSVSAVEQ